jgi:molybdopterin synthase sulfur carrier subunit
MGITTEIEAGSAVDCSAVDTPRSIVEKFSVSADLTFLRVALDQEYCDWDTPVGQAAELALMPPVSGG